MATPLYTSQEVIELVNIGFCQQRFYKRSVWRKARKLMDTVLCPNDLARPFNFGRGKGKYATEFPIRMVADECISILRQKGQIKDQQPKQAKGR